MAGSADVEEEQRFLDRAYEGLAAMRADATRMLESVLDLGRGGTFQSRTERDIVVRTSLARLAQLEIGSQALCFGRIDRLPEDGRDGLETFHIGRLAISGESLEPLVVDWRAPVAEPFYRATGLDPQGLARRRHLAVSDRVVTGVEDEYFAQPGAGGEIGVRDGLAEVGGFDWAGRADGSGGRAPGQEGRLLEAGLALGGPGALLAALDQARTGHMGDIVGTIQREQDEIIRSPLPGVLVVQGGPGTGKTAVALHRAAYLLYTHRFPLERQGVLVIGPNPLFLRYIEQVLPSLGETGVTLSTVSGLVPEVRVRGVDPQPVARLKGEARMAKVMAQAVRTRQRSLRQDLEVPFGSTVLRLSAERSAEIIRAGRRRPGVHNARRRFVESQVVAWLADQYVSRLSGTAERGGESAWGPEATGSGLAAGEHDGPAIEVTDVRRQIRRSAEVVEALDRMWPRLAPHELLHDLLGARPLLAAAGKGVLSDDELSLLYRPRSTSLDDVRWTVADAALVDQARALLGPRRGRARRPRPDGRDRVERAREEVGFWPAGLDTAPVTVGARDPLVEPEEMRLYGHIVVDEVQDLSPMQLRMLGRRSISGSMTVVGDIAQATGPWAPKSWDEVTRHLGTRRPPRRVELTVSYRTPLEVLRLAERVLAVAAPELTPPRPVRVSGVEPLVVTAPNGTLAQRSAATAIAQMEALAPGRVAVLAPEGLLGALRQALGARGVEAVDPRDPKGAGLGAPLVLLPAAEVNGLEFDGVVVVEPALIAGGGDAGGGDAGGGDGGGGDGGGSGDTRGAAGTGADAAADAGLDAGADAGAARPAPPATTRGLRTLYVACTRSTQQLSIVHELALPVDLVGTPAPLLAVSGDA